MENTKDKMLRDNQALEWQLREINAERKYQQVKAEERLSQQKGQQRVLLEESVTLQQESGDVLGSIQDLIRK